MDTTTINPLSENGTNMTDNDPDYVAYDGDISKFDYVQYMPGDSLQLIHSTWPQDPAFLPTSITYSLAFLIGKSLSCSPPLTLCLALMSF